MKTTQLCHLRKKNNEEENGAYCDCEILYNVVEKFED